MPDPATALAHANVALAEENAALREEIMRLHELMQPPEPPDPETIDDPVERRIAEDNRRAWVDAAERMRKEEDADGTP
jgi:hypothetical protein